MQIPARFKLAASLLAALSAGMLSGCLSDTGTPAGAYLGRPAEYDYSPTMIQTGTTQQFWWCGQGVNPVQPKQNTDAILYESIDTVTHKHTDPLVVMAETPGAWDTAFTCNPKVVRGSFQNPLGDGQSYTYALYYVATAAPAGVDNSIGVAFSNDGIEWNKFPHPIIPSSARFGYGVGQPAVYNQDGKSSIVMLYEDNTPDLEHVKALSSDGVHFTIQGRITRRGFDPNNQYPSWGDAAYDPATKYWYAAFDLGTRYPTTTGNYIEHGQYGLQLYRIPDASLLNGDTPWQMLRTFDTNATGNESNFLATFLRDQYGSLHTAPYPKLQLFTTISNPKPGWDYEPVGLGKAGDLFKWDIGTVTWDPAVTTLPLVRYKNGSSYEVTTGYVSEDSGFVQNALLGHLYVAPQNGASTPIYACKNSARDFTISLDSNCGGLYIAGLEGYGYSKAPSTQPAVAIYRCNSADRGHFASKDAQCEGSGAGELVGYALP